MCLLAFLPGGSCLPDSQQGSGAFLVYPEFIPERAPLDSQQGNVSSLALEFTLGVCLLACLPGVGGRGSILLTLLATGVLSF